MSARNYLLFIDECPVPNDLEIYFAQFDIEIKVQKRLNPIAYPCKQLMALIIHWRLIEHQPQILYQIYQTHAVPILVINDKPNETACISALEAGADDYLHATITPKALHAKIKTITRRIATKTKKSNVLQFAKWKLNPASRQIFDKNNSELVLSAGEYDLLYLFVKRPQLVLDREYLSQSSKPADHNPFDRRIDVQISRLRQKIEADAKKPSLIVTVRNGGYMFTAEVEHVE